MQRKWSGTISEKPKFDLKSKAAMWKLSFPFKFNCVNSKPLQMKVAAAAAAKSLQSCPTLCDPADGSPPGSPVPGILQARTLEWVAIPFSNA